jgi:hypothetical protein
LVFQNIFLSAVGDGGKKFSAISPTALKIFYCRRRQRLDLFSDVGDSAKKYNSAIFKP